jgi:large-conductance mechanosensitive channel
MNNGFLKFIKEHITVTVLISVVVYKIFGAILDGLISPLLFMIIDKNNDLPKMQLKSGKISIDYGSVFRTILVSFLSLYIIYFVTTL